MDISTNIRYLAEWTYDLLSFVCYLGLENMHYKIVFKYQKIVGNCPQGINSRILLIFVNDRLGLMKIPTT